ncbi:tyrosine-type recombinase/integrase [Microcoleus sp. T3_D1]|uniref:tyrosine-type recombinase/integrase n=1 Tax=Microcoleus sp. T3_D1 TaxID=3055427 RepID=UPI002FD252F4
MKLAPIPQLNLQIVASNSTTEQLVNLWVHGKSKNTQKLYRRVSGLLLGMIGKAANYLTLADLQNFADTLELRGLSTSSRRTYIAVVKSLLTFGHKTGLIQVNAGAALNTPKPKDTLSQKILTEAEVKMLIASEPCDRNRLIFKVFYYAGLRVSELCGLNWEDLTSNGESGQLLIYGKGDKTRVVLLPLPLYRELLNSRSDAGNLEPIFKSRKKSDGGRLNPISVTQMVKVAAVRVGLSDKASAHWLRHCHASHALNRGAPIHLLSQTLGHASVATTSKYLHAKPNDSSGLYLM